MSRETLDRSVTKLSHESGQFPDAFAGISEWRAARGGVFTINVAEIVALIDAQTAHVGEPVQPGSRSGR